MGAFQISFLTFVVGVFAAFGISLFIVDRRCNSGPVAQSPESQKQGGDELAYRKPA